MTPVLSKYAQLRKNAQSHYDAVIFPSTASEYDAMNPAPRRALEIELARINEKEAKEGRTW